MNAAGVGGGEWEPGVPLPQQPRVPLGVFALSVGLSRALSFPREPVLARCWLVLIPSIGDDITSPHTGLME